MSKSHTFAIKNEQIAGAINLGSLKEKLSKKKEEPEKIEEQPAKAVKPKKALQAHEKEEKPKKKALAKGAYKEEESVVAEDSKKKKAHVKPKTEKATQHAEEVVQEKEGAPVFSPRQELPRQELPRQEPLRQETDQHVVRERKEAPVEVSSEPPVQESPKQEVAKAEPKPQAAPQPRLGPYGPVEKQPVLPSTRPSQQPTRFSSDGKDRGGSSYQTRAPNGFQGMQPLRLQPVSGRQERRDYSGQKELVRPMLPKENAESESFQPRRADERYPSREGDRRPPMRSDDVGGAPYQSSRPPYQGTRPPYQEGSRPPYQGNRPPYQEGSRPPYQGNRPPYQEGSRPPYQGNRPPYQEGSRPPYQGTRPPYQGGARPPYQGTRPPYQGGGRPPYQGGPGSRPPYQGGARPPYQGARPFAPRLPRVGEPMPARGEDDGVRRYEEKRGEEKRDKVKVKEGPTGKGVKKPQEKIFDARARHGFISGDDDDSVWRGKRKSKMNFFREEVVVRPTKIKVRLPITIKDLAQEMKLKSSEIIAKLFIQGQVHTLNDLLVDPDVVVLIGHDFGCEVTIDTSEEARIRISDKNVREEIAAENQEMLITRPPVVAFMGHVDHGKTSLIDAIRSSNRAAKEVGAITQHIGAFSCETSHGPITILDTPGHEAFTLMRERGANITDIVILVVAGDEGIQEQTIEAIRQAREAKATILVAITKSDKPTFDKDLVYRQLADQNLLPEAWGGQIVAVPCSAVTKEGITELLEMIAIQSEVLELKANPLMRARGMVIESQMQQGLGSVATLLIQNGTLRLGDSIVFGSEYGKVKTMRDENGDQVPEAGPSKSVLVTGLSGLPAAGDEFISVKNDKEAKEIAEKRREGKRENLLTKKRPTMESFMDTSDRNKKILNIVLRADVQGSLEALAKALEKIVSTRAVSNIISRGVGQISESDVELASTSKAIILGFHTSVEAHAEAFEKELHVKVLLHDIIYHAVDAVKEEMKALLDKIPVETHKGKAEVKALFKSSHVGMIAGCLVLDGSITRSNQVRLKRGEEIVWTGPIASLKRVKEDVREVTKGTECGILLSCGSLIQVGDSIEAFEVTYIDQEL